MEKQLEVRFPGLKARTGVTSGYWTCTGVKGQHDQKGYYWNYPTAALCYKPKYAPIFGAPVAPGGDDS